LIDEGGDDFVNLVLLATRKFGDLGEKLFALAVGSHIIS